MFWRGGFHSSLLVDQASYSCGPVDKTCIDLWKIILAKSKRKKLIGGNIINWWGVCKSELFKELKDVRGTVSSRSVHHSFSSLVQLTWVKSTDCATYPYSMTEDPVEVESWTHVGRWAVVDGPLCHCALSLVNKPRWPLDNWVYTSCGGLST